MVSWTMEMMETQIPGLGFVENPPAVSFLSGYENTLHDRPLRSEERPGGGDRELQSARGRPKVSGLEK